jgi:hypothetical protein
MAMTELRAEAEIAAVAELRAEAEVVAATRSDPKLTSLGLPVAREYIIQESEPIGDFVQMELVSDGHTSSPGLGIREDGLVEIMIEIAEDRQ